MQNYGGGHKYSPVVHDFKDLWSCAIVLLLWQKWSMEWLLELPEDWKCVGSLVHPGSKDSQIVQPPNLNGWRLWQFCVCRDYWESSEVEPLA